MNNSQTVSFQLFLNNFTLISSSILIIVSFIGNLLSVYTITRPELRSISLFRFLGFSSLLNNVSNFFILIVTFQTFFGVNKSYLNCSVYRFLSYVPITTSVWIVVYTGIDRVISVKFPKQYLFRDKICFQLVVVFVILLGALSINVTRLFTGGLVLNPETNQTVCKTIKFQLEAYGILALFTYTQAIPILLFLLLALITFHYLSVSKKKLNKKLLKERKFLKLFLSISFFYAISQLPYGIYIVTSNFLKIDHLQEILFHVLFFFTSIYNGLDFVVLYFSNSVYRKCFNSVICFINSRNK